MKETFKSIPLTTQEAERGFYPTPLSVAEKLLTDVNWNKIQTVLEPSAGKGDLVKAIVQKVADSDQKSIEIDCIEIDPNLRSILQYGFTGEQTQDTSEFHIVHDDFLTFDSRKCYDLIVMNPPFANGDSHLLKALELQEKNGGMIRCILNAETIRNPYTNKRRLLKSKLEECNATISYISDVFTNAERKTNVEIAIIRIEIPKKKTESRIFERLQKAAEIDFNEADVNALTVNDFFEQLVSRFNVEVDAGLELIREYNAMKPYMLEDFQTSSKPTMTLVIGSSHWNNKDANPNQYLKLVRQKYWKALFTNKEFTSRLTSNLSTKYQGMISEMVDYDFSMFNIQRIIMQTNSEMKQGIQDTIIALFDKLTTMHTWYPEMKKNIHYFNGWKSNKAHKVNDKVILPVNGMFATYSWSKTFEVRKAEAVISDIEKVFNYLDGNMTAPVDLHDTLERACDEGRTRNIRCRYFDVKLYKKGTMHIKFRNKDLLNRFNIYCAQQKRWLPPSYGHAVYSHMSEEERSVVDNFHGDGSKESGIKDYEKILNNASYFFASPTHKMPALTASVK